MDYIEEFDKLKTKVLKYILFKKRTEQEVRLKFKIDESELLNEVIDELKELNYINDKNYIEKAVNEYINLKNLSIREIRYKLASKGIKFNLIEEYINVNEDRLLEYEKQSAINIINKKQNTMEKTQIFEYLIKKGYKEETVKKGVHDE